MERAQFLFTSISIIAVFSGVLLLAGLNADEVGTFAAVTTGVAVGKVISSATEDSHE